MNQWRIDRRFQVDPLMEQVLRKELRELDEIYGETKYVYCNTTLLFKRTKIDRGPTVGV